jgi:hypothetical protein
MLGLCSRQIGPLPKVSNFPTVSGVKKHQLHLILSWTAPEGQTRVWGGTNIFRVKISSTQSLFKRSRVKCSSENQLVLGVLKWQHNGYLPCTPSGVWGSTSCKEIYLISVRNTMKLPISRVNKVRFTSFQITQLFGQAHSFCFRTPWIWDWPTEDCGPEIIIEVAL